MGQEVSEEKVVEDNSVSYEINYNNTPYDMFISDSYQAYNIHTVKRWLKDHNRYNRELRQLSNYLYNANGSYTNMIDYIVAMPTLDRIVFSRNSKYSNYKDNKRKFEETLQKIREKTIVRDMLFKYALEGTTFYYFESNKVSSFPKYLSDEDIDQVSEINEEFNASVLPLPTDYCRIIGTVNGSPQIAFNCAYFDQFKSNGQSKKLRRYPKEIRTAYNQYRKDKSKQWVVLNNDKTITLKSRAKMEDRWGRPVGLAGYIDMLYEEYFIDSKRNVLDDVNSTIIYQTFPEGEKKGTSSLTQKQQKEQHDNIKNALFSKGSTRGVNFFSVAGGTKIDKLKTDIDLLDKDSTDLLTRISTSLGFAGSMLNGSGGSMNSQRYNLRLISSKIFSWLEQIQDELNKVINKNIIQDEKNYIELYYLPITHVNREDMIKHFKELYTHAGGSRQAYIASVGVNPDAYIALMDEEIELGFDKKYKPHQTSFTQSNKDTDGKKPIDNDPENPATLKNKQTGANPIE